MPTVYPFPLTLPTYQPVLSSRLAPIFEKGKVPLYPYTSFLKPAAPPREQTFKMWALENRHLRAIVAPELGGRLWSLRDKRLRTPDGREGPGAELLYSNTAVKPYTVEPRNSYISSGIEFNFPVAHSHTSLEPVAHRAYEMNGRACVEVGETERRLGLTWIIRLSLGEDDAFLTQETFLHNPTSRPAKWHLWSNAAVDAFMDTEFIYPPGKIVVHGSKNDFDRWPMNWSRIGHREGMLGLFWLDHTDIYFGAFHHPIGVGLMHLADPRVVTGTKLWTWGGKEGTDEWAKLLADDGRGMAEVQSGAFKTQEEYGTMQPGESAYFIEFWTGASSPEDYKKAGLPQPRIGLPPPRWFGMEHIPEARRWLAVQDAHRKNAPAELPAYDPADLDWPPSGMELHAPLRWAAQHKPAYRTALGMWLAAREIFTEAAEVLDGSDDPFGRRIRGILAWRVEKDLPKARRLYESADFVESGHLLELDALLAHIGDHAARPGVLARMDANKGSVTERQADLLVGAGKPREAIELLMTSKWSREHERFIRTDIWRRARAALGERQDPVPEHLGEDKVPGIDQAPTPHGTRDGLLRKLE